MITKRNAYNKADCAKMYPNVLDKFMITFTANDKRQFVSPCDQFFFSFTCRLAFPMQPGGGTPANFG